MKTRGGKFKDYTGMKFNRLTALEFVKRENHKTYWKYKCDCGNEIILNASEVATNSTKSCGCLFHEGNRHTHNMSNSRIYHIWRSMHIRCYLKNSHNYKNYGAKGIKICKEWKDDFIAFYNWSIKNGYNENLTIDRINNSRGYSPNNCRWVDMKAQNNNKTNNRLITYNEKTMTAKQWSEYLNINYNTFLNRLNTMSIERALQPKLFYARKDETI